MLKKRNLLFFSSLLFLISTVRAEPFDAADLAGTDDLGRALPPFSQTGSVKPNRTVGMFYWQWHGDLRARPDAYDMTDYLKLHPKTMDFDAVPFDHPKNPTYYWAQPIFGYYRSTDPWVIRKQLPMIAATGVNFLFLDYTNAFIYDSELTTFLSVAESLKQKGLAVPQLTFFLHHEPEWKIEALYTEWYKPGKHDDMWFRWRGKPLLMTAMPTDASKFKNPALLPEIQKFFTWRPTWALGLADKDPHLWRFLSNPTDAPSIDEQGNLEEMVVCKSAGGPVNNNFADGGVSGRGDGKVYTAADYNDDWMLPNAADGIYFQAEWDHAMKVAPPILLVTGWNEWTASVWYHDGVRMLGRTTTAKQGHIVDEFNMQFNRDIEPMKGGYGDNYYWQFAENMRKYKGMNPPQPVSAMKSMALDGPVSQWSGVTPEFRGVEGIAADRDWEATLPKKIRYVDQSARNEIALAQVAHDQSTVWFHVHTTQPLTSETDPDWMILLINVDQNPKTGWHGYDLMVNRSRNGSQASVEKNEGNDWSWSALPAAGAHWDGNDLTLALPRSLFREGSLRFDFKWIDNLGPTPDVMDFYSKGSVAPVGRFDFRYEERQLAN